VDFVFLSPNRGLPFFSLSPVSQIPICLKFALGDLADVGANGYVIADAIRIERLSPLMAETQVVNESHAAASLTIEQVDRLYETAVAHWSLTDPSAASRLANVDVRIADLSGAVLGLASHVTDTIWLDTNAAGHGWHISDQRSAISSRPAMDLLTVLTHEPCSCISGTARTTIGACFVAISTRFVAVGQGHIR
jgi:hypothetical protein